MKVVRETVVVQVIPKWQRMAFCVAVSGLPHYVIRKLYNDREIRARKVDAAQANSATIYHVQDILDWIETEAQEPPPFKLPAVKVGIAEETLTAKE